jgi:tRNA nucleotidyltransferase/poly(A) polymerase
MRLYQKSLPFIENAFQEHLLGLPLFAKVSEAARDLGVEVYLIGGYVRDFLLGRPCKDIDFMCVGDGLQMAERVAQSLGPMANVAFFKNFGTAQIKWEDYELEFVGARKESYREDSRKPLVENGTLDDDLQRRDFTINALAVSLHQFPQIQFIDPFNGLKDLKRKVIRTPLDPAITFSDDPLRMLRAIRFASQLEFDIEPGTFEGIMQSSSRMSIVSMERVHVELNKIILTKKPSYGFKLLMISGLLQEIFPELVELQGVETIEDKSHKDNFYHTLQVLDNVAERSDDLWLRWAALLHDIAKPATKRFHPKQGWTFHGHEDRGSRMVPKIFRRLKLPLNDKMKFVQKLVRLHLRPIPLVKDEVTDSAIRRLMFEAGDDLEALMLLCRADVTSKNNAKVKRYLRNFDIVEQKMQEVEAKDRVRNFQPPVSGEEIMQLYGLKPSRIVGDLKEAIKEAILEGEIANDRKQALDLLKKLAKKEGLSLSEKFNQQKTS